MTEPGKTFVGLHPEELRVAGLRWLERAARLALDDDTMYDTQTSPHDDASTEAFEINTVGDKLLQQRNIAEAALAALAAQIGNGLLMAAGASLPLDTEVTRGYHGGSPEPIT